MNLNNKTLRVSRGVTVGAAIAVLAVGATTVALALPTPASVDISTKPMGWLQEFGSSQGDSGNCACNPVAVSAGGDVYVSGGTFGTIGGAPQGASDVFLTKLSGSSGAIRWSKQFGSSGYETAHAVAVAGNGDVYIVGETDGNLQGTHRGSDAFLAKYNKNGIQRWVRQIGSSLDDYGMAIAITSGGVLIAGQTDGIMDGAPEGTVAHGKDAFVSKWSTSGQRLWMTQFGTDGDEIGGGFSTMGLGVGSKGAIYVAGQSTGTFAGNDATVLSDAFIARFTKKGVFVNAKQIGGPGSQEIDSLAIGPGGTVYVGGVTNEDIEDGITTAGPSSDAFLAKFDKDLNRLWLHQHSVTGTEFLLSIAVAKNGNVFATGATEGDIDGAGPGEFAGAVLNAFALSYDAVGGYRWARQLAAGSSDFGSGIALLPNGRLVVSGSTHAALFGMVNRGKDDVFVTSMTTG